MSADAVAPPPGAPDAPAAGPADATEFRVAEPAFEGTLGELAHALRTGRVTPTDLDLYALVRAFLAHFDAWAGRDLALASEALPKVAQVIELKLRLLLPKPPPDAEDEDPEEDLAETLAAVALLEELEHAIDFLRARRRERRVTLTARTPRPDYPRPERPLDVAVERLGELAGRLRSGGYFEMAIDRLTLASAMRGLLRRLRRFGGGRLWDVYAAPDWATRTVVFAGLLELVREGKVNAEQDEPQGEIRVDLGAASTGSVDAARPPDEGAPDNSPPDPH